MNIVIISGNLTKDTEYRAFDNGGVSTSTVAVTRDYKTKDGEKLTDFFIVKAKGKLAEIVNNYGKKGVKALIEGRLEMRDYVDKSGVKRTITEIIAQSIEFNHKSEEKSNAGKQDEEKDDINIPGLPF